MIGYGRGIRDHDHGLTTADYQPQIIEIIVEDPLEIIDKDVDKVRKIDRKDIVKLYDGNSKLTSKIKQIADSQVSTIYLFIKEGIAYLNLHRDDLRYSSFLCG